MTETVINGWILKAHPAFMEQLKALMAAAAQEQVKGKAGKSTKLLRSVQRIVYEAIPANPADPAFAQGLTLGKENTGWRRATFNQQYRLFFRYRSIPDSTAGLRGVIVLGWFNDDESLRAYDSKTDAYKIFQTMLENGNPPSDWDELLAQSGVFSDTPHSAAAPPPTEEKPG